MTKKSKFEKTGKKKDMVKGVDYWGGWADWLGIEKKKKKDEFDFDN